MFLFQCDGCATSTVQLANSGQLSIHFLSGRLFPSLGNMAQSKHVEMVVAAAHVHSRFVNGPATRKRPLLVLGIVHAGHDRPRRSRFGLCASNQTDPEAVGNKS